MKVGTSTLTNAQGRIDRAFIADLTAQMARLRAQGCDVVLVTSGAIRAGREALRQGTGNMSASGRVEQETEETCPASGLSTNNKRQAASNPLACA